MKKYEVVIVRTICDTYEVKARNKKDAIMKACAAEDGALQHSECTDSDIDSVEEIK